MQRGELHKILYITSSRAKHLHRLIMLTKNIQVQRKTTQAL